jgi:hypothetical protein
LFRRAIADLETSPGRYLRLCLRRLRYFLLFDETNPKSRVAAYRIPHLALSLFAMSGLLLAGSSFRMRMIPTIATAVLITAFHTLTIVSARFHIPIEPLLGLWGAAGLARAVEVVAIHRSRSCGVKRLERIVSPHPRSRHSVIVGALATSASDRTRRPR